MPQPTPTQPTDAQVIRFARNDRDAGCRQIIESFAPNVKAALKRRLGDFLDDDDCLSALGEAATRLLNAIADDRFDSTRKIGPWLVQTAHNIALSTIRDQHRRQHRDNRSDLDPDVPDFEDEDEERSVDPRKASLLNALAEEIEKLPAERRRVVKMSLVVNGDAKKAAKALGKTVGNYYATLNQAQKDLAKRLEQRGFTYP